MYQIQVDIFSYIIYSYLYILTTKERKKDQKCMKLIIINNVQEERSLYKYI
jgi:hypothetical protein